MFHHAFDGAALAGGVAPFEQNHDALARLLGPGLQFEKLNLQLVLLRLVGLARQQVLVGVGPAAPVARQQLVGVGAVARLAANDHRIFFQQAPYGLDVIGGGALQNGAQGIRFVGLAGLGLGEHIPHGGKFGLLARVDLGGHRKLGNALGQLAAGHVAELGAPGRLALFPTCPGLGGALWPQSASASPRLNDALQAAQHQGAALLKAATANTPSCKPRP